MNAAKLNGKVIVVTGGTSGIGRAAAHLFAQEGAAVVIGANDKAGGASILGEIQEIGRGTARFVYTDVAKPEQVERLISKAVSDFGQVDVLFGNAGILALGSVWETPLDTWRMCIDVNLSGNFFLAKYGIPHLIKNGGGTVLFTASELGLVGVRSGAAYCASKGGMINLARAIALDCAPHGIRVNCVAPGPIRTPLAARGFESADDPLAAERAQIEAVPMKRMGTPEEIAQVALFLISDDSAYMTGSVVVADGGATAWYGL